MDAKILEMIAEQTGLTFDGGDDTRLFHPEMVNVFASVMSEKEYNKMETNLNKTIKGKGYTVYAWNDSSGFNYWNRDDESNYIQVTVDIQDLNKINLKQLKSDVEKHFDYFMRYDNIEQWHAKKYGG